MSLLGKLSEGHAELAAVFATSLCFCNSFKIKVFCKIVPENRGVDDNLLPAECGNSAGAHRHVANTPNEKSVPWGHVYRDLRARNPAGVCGGQEPLLVHLERHSTLEACCFYLAEGTDGTINETKRFLRNSGLGPFSTTLGGI